MNTIQLQSLRIYVHMHINKYICKQTHKDQILQESEARLLICYKDLSLDYHL